MHSEERAPTILVVDDNSENLALASATLEDEGYKVVLATSGEEGLRAFQEHAPDCVLLDIRMPNMDGFTACAKLRELPGGPETPVIFLTALRDIDTFEKSLHAGGDDFLTKPVRPTELVSRVQAALKLRRMGAELREHYALVRKQRDDLMRLQLQKERLMMFVVHDLKNPVNCIDLHAQALSRKRDLPDTAKESAQLIRDEVRALMLLILNLLDISKSEEGELHPTPTSLSLRNLVQSSVASLDVRARAKNITLTTSLEDVTFSGDPDLLHRVLENLLENSIRYAPTGSDIQVATHLEPGRIQVRISDHGAGVPPELRQKIFERFVQLETDLGTRTGRGLGLAFCKLAVEAHGGQISVEDGNPGATFCITLPHV